jgi:hypothetical protein
MSEKRTPRQTAAEIEVEQNFPILNKYSKVGKTVEKMEPGIGKDLATGAYFGGMVPVGTAAILHSAATGRRGRSEEEMNELTREVGRAQRAEKKAKGGIVKSASSRADGIAKKGKTKGTMVKMAGGGKCY